VRIARGIRQHAAEHLDPAHATSPSAHVHGRSSAAAGASEVRGIAPSARHFWAPGYYRYNGREHVWVGGRWELRRDGFEFIGPHWVRRFGRFEYIPGRWIRRV